jgi:hypothetical protein
MRISIRESSGKTSTDVAEALKGFGGRVSGDIAGLTEKLVNLERRMEDASDVLVLWFKLTPGDLPITRSNTKLVYALKIPPGQREKASRVFSKVLPVGAVNFFERDTPVKLAGVVATAQPIVEQTMVQVEITFPGGAALDDFEKHLRQSDESHKTFGLRVMFSAG